MNQPPREIIKIISRLPVDRGGFVINWNSRRDVNWYVLYMKWFFYTNDPETTGGN